jgi:hypothetical protein
MDMYKCNTYAEGYLIFLATSYQNGKKIYKIVRQYIGIQNGKNIPNYQKIDIQNGSKMYQRTILYTAFPNPNINITKIGIGIQTNHLAPCCQIVDIFTLCVR